MERKIELLKNIIETAENNLNKELKDVGSLFAVQNAIIYVKRQSYIDGLKDALKLILSTK